MSFLIFLQPLSDASRKYILNLDIEADARLLHEQLNITSDSLDYFRASSRILKAGVKAGLTLYEIAVMCCRNDNLGEVPSKLEILFSMAEELALSALENGRWHHTAASRALAEQLSPRGASLIPQRRSSASCSDGSRMYKSASSAEFKTVNFDYTGMEDDSSKKQYTSPGMTQSSGSDSSSECGDLAGEKEDCDEWAAALLNNISMDRSMSMLAEGREGRSDSIGSEDDSDKGSPRGFWTTRPGSPSMHALDDDDDESWNLSPEVARRHVDLSSVPDRDFMPLPVSPIANEGAPSRTHAVTFAEDTWIIKELEVPSSLSVDIPPMPSKSEVLPMKRSQSYSAISEFNLSSGGGSSLGFSSKSTGRLPNPCTKEYDQFRDYFLKFVDLVIVRETKAATLQTQLSDITA